MLDFSKRLGKRETKQEIDPVKIYDLLDRKSETGPLRPVQNEILSEWFEKRKDEKDLIIKLHTGEGKTLVGLLLLLSKANSTKEPCLYICPNKYLVDQVCLDAGKFGIPVCKLEKNTFPDEFLSGNSILVTHVQKLFNGKSIFKINAQSQKVNTIILDDSHACIDSIKNSFTINIPRGHRAYNEFKTLFNDEMIEQGEGTFYELENLYSSAIIPIPYWCWIDKNSEVVKILSRHSDEDIIKFSWPILRDDMKFCQAFMTVKKLEISPIHLPVNVFGTFHDAKQRVLMSATTQDDSFFIKGLGFSENAIKHPLINTTKKWSGEKIIVIPSLISENLDRNVLIEHFAPRCDYTFGVVTIVPSFKKATDYSEKGANVVDSTSEDNLYRTVSALKKGEYGKMVVLINRYDGIDLPDSTCRVLFIDSMPYFDTLNERYEEQCRSSSDIINTRLAQKIEQGLGRSVRGAKDFSVIIVIGGDLVKFIKSVSTKKYFSPQTQKQIEIGLEVAKMVVEDIGEGRAGILDIRNIVNQVLKRDAAWKRFYSQEMDSLTVKNENNPTLGILQKEKEAIDALISRNNSKAVQLIQSIVDQVENDNEKGWYLQMAAHFQYYESKAASNALQVAAFRKNHNLLTPKNGAGYKKLELINNNRVERLKEAFEQLGNYQEILIHCDSILSNFAFGSDSEKAEKALQDIGVLLGCLSQRPDKEFKRGPDNLWCVGRNQYILFECKTEVDESRSLISKTEAGQMEQHCNWFENEYSTEVHVRNVLIHPTKNMAKDAFFSKRVNIMRKHNINQFKGNIKNFVKEFQSFIITDLNDALIQKFLTIHQLDDKSLFSQYAEVPVHPTNSG